VDYLPIVIVALIVPFAVCIGMYNGLVKQRNMVEEAWSHIDVALKRRANLLPQLLGATRDYVKHETGTLEEVTRQRSDSADTGQRYQQEAMISRSLIDVLARAEAYPDLKASANFLELQRAISEVEKEIAAARSTYNRRVRQLNTTVEQFPSNLMARRFAFDRQAYFQLELATERDMPLA
jgi:LemA protein